ncbi:MAG: DUF6988 family protein [Lysobacteraceae bacterium]
MKHAPLERCRQSKALAANLASLLPPQAPPLQRTALVSAAVGLGFEHHHAIAHLIESSHFASAAALVRPLLETVTTAVWMLYVADHALIVEVLLQDRPLPKPQTMLSAIEKRPELKGHLGLKELMDGPGRYFHGLTHGDMRSFAGDIAPPAAASPGAKTS